MNKITFILLFAFQFAFSQNFEWVKNPPISFDSNGSMIGYTTTCDPSQNVYISGYKQNTFLYGEIFGDVFYNKYNDEGELQFSKTFTGQATIYDMASDAQGNILVCAGFVNFMTVGDLNLSTVDQSVQNVLFKFDSEGVLLWHEQFAIAESFECRLHSVTTDANDNIYVGYYDFMDSYIKKLDPNGSTLLTIPQLDVRMISSLSVDNAGNIYAAGSCANPGATYNGVAASTTFFYNTFLVKYDPEGNYQWVRYVDDITCPEPQVVANTPNEVYFSSYLFGDYTFDGIPTEGPQSMFSDFFITRLNSEGTFQWVREVPGSGFVAPGGRRYLSADTQGNVYFVGATRWTIDWNSEITTSGQSFSDDALVLQYDKDGDLLMAKTAGGESNDRVDAVAINASGDIFIAGMMRGNASFDAFSFEAEQYDYWPFLAKMNNVALGTPDNQLPGIGLYPNPSSDYVYISGTAKTIDGSIFNMLGQKVLDFTVDIDHPINIQSLSQGTYLIKANGFKNMKLLKN